MSSSLGVEAMLLLRLAVATALAAAVGWEREQAGKPAGLRTHMLVGLASALYTGLATLAIAEAPGLAPGVRGDPGRIIQAVALGIGFLGGGVISAGRHDGRSHNLTTAASIWSTAGIGIAVGLGHYLLAVGATLLQLVVLHAFARFDRRAALPSDLE
jgi:putative Mg2+ transporter-C (MgtC) family protein